MKEKLKIVDGIDVDEIRRKDFEIRNKFDNGQRFVKPELQYEIDHINGDMKVIEEPVYLKN